LEFIAVSKMHRELGRGGRADLGQHARSAADLKGVPGPNVSASPCRNIMNLLTAGYLKQTINVDFEGSEIFIQPSFGVYVTMNPGLPQDQPI